MHVPPSGAAVRAAFAAFLALAGCDSAAERAGKSAESVESVDVRIAGEAFELELALDAAARHRGLGGRASIDPSGGMLFVFPRAHPQTFVMRDCRVPIDVAFLDPSGRVVSVHPMQTETPRADDESAAQYEARLRHYGSVFPAQFALEIAGGRLQKLGVVAGQRIPLDTASLVRRAR